MGFQIRIAEPGDEPRDVELTTSTEVGRHVEGIRLLDASVSRRHVLLDVTPQGLVCVDLGSTYGTRVNGHVIAGPTLLRVGDVVRLGDTELTVLADRRTTLAPPIPPEPAVPAAPTPGPVTSPPPVAAAPAPSPVPSAAATAPPASPAAARPSVAELQALDADGAATIRFRPGSAGERSARSMAARARKARRQLAGFGSEPWGIVPQICLVDPFPDPADPTRLVTSGSIVDAQRNEIWVVVTSESPPEDPTRPLALLFGASLPAADDLEPLFEGFGLWLSGADDPDEQLAPLAAELPPLALATGELRAAMALSFVRFLVEREKADGLRRLFGTTQAGRLDAAAQEVYGLGMTALEMAWREQLLSGGPRVKTGQFLRLSLRYLRPYKWKQAEIFVYMLLSLAFTMVFPFATRRLFDTALPAGIDTGSFRDVGVILGALGVALVISLLAGLRQNYQSAWISGAVVRDIRSQMFAKQQSLSTGWYKTHQQGDVLTRLFNDVMVVEQGLTSTLRDGLFQMLSLVVSAVVMLTINVPLGLIVLAGAPVVALIYKGMSKGAQKRGLAVQEDTGSLMGMAAENYGAEPVVKVFGLQHHEVERFGRLSERLFRSERRLNLFGGLFGLSVNMVVTILRLGILALGSWFIIQGNFTFGGLVAFLGIMGEVLSPVTVLTGIGQQVQSATGALYRIDEVLEEEPELVEAEQAVTLAPLSHELRLVGVGFSYNAERQVLSDVNAVIRAGSRVAFVGPSGSGKSTVLQLLMRLYDTDEGAVLFDGTDLRHASVASLRSQLGVVFQDNFLFDTTVRENIRLGRPGATDAEIEAAARAAEVHDFIEQLPRGYDTTVGERGGMLSGGQRQRVAIARALVRNPRVLLLDEATSALDPKTERQITATLNRIAQGRTTIAITHRLTSVVDYDCIFVIVDGHIVEQGTHDELVALGGAYARLWSEQTGAVVPLPSAAPVFDPGEALARVALFAGVDPAVLHGVAARLQAVEVQPGQGVPDGQGRLWIVARGRGRVLSPAMGGGLAPTAELRPGDVFGQTALLGGDEGSYFEAVEPTTLLLLGDEVISGLAHTEPSVRALLEGARGGAAPEGGRRLSRLTVAMRPGVGLATPVPGGAGPATIGGIPAGVGALREDGGRMTGVFGGPRP
ncbi:MAG: ATP-binding cassette domain-containing protein [Acidimicrobiales bacterium]|nr:ATP-binding cassette domain-containing protein [Acidimicrobiales bacterium]